VCDRQIAQVRHRAREPERDRDADLERTLQAPRSADRLRVIDLAENPQTPLVIGAACGVTVIRRVVRAISSAPSSSSSAETCRLTAAAETRSCRAADDRLPASITRTYVDIFASRSIFCSVRDS
jgi:hypothetical protein